MHLKHPKLARPALGNYARTEFALVGSTCERMEAIMRQWAARLTDFHTILVTGEHAEPETAVSVRHERKHFSSKRTVGWNEFDDRLLGERFDLALVNGNHYPAARQIVFIDKHKAGTLVRRKSELSNVFAVVFVEGVTELPRWLVDHLAGSDRQPIITGLDGLDGIFSLISQQLVENTPSLKAVILAGGISSRMGSDKGSLIYRDGQTEIERLRDLCTQLGLHVNLSVSELREGDLPEIVDRFVGLGPAGAICSAFLTDPDTAWLVLACDLPLLDATTLQQLITGRRADRVATAVRAPGEQWPEPLVAIYEPRAYPRLLQFLSLGYSCPRKLLINSDVEVVDLHDATAVANANTPEERDRLAKTLKARISRP